MAKADRINYEFNPYRLDVVIALYQTNLSGADLRAILLILAQTDGYRGPEAKIKPSFFRENTGLYDSNLRRTIGRLRSWNMISKKGQVYTVIPPSEWKASVFLNPNRNQIDTVSTPSEGLGYRILVNRTSKAVKNIVGRAAAINADIRRMGINAKAPALGELREISMNPVKMFGFNKSAFSSEMAGRLLPQHKGIAEAGTMEHIFTKWEMYNWQGLEKGLDYVIRVNEINQSVLALLQKEGVPPKHIIDDWIHRVVEGIEVKDGFLQVKGRPGMGGRRLGAKPSYEKPRKFETMADGIAHGVRYNVNPEVSIDTYIEEAFNKIGYARANKYHAPYGITPERLAERFPELLEAASLTKQELAGTAKFHSLINRAIRGEKLPAQTLNAIEKRFPELGRKFRSLVEAPGKAESQLRDLLAQKEKTIRQLQARIEKAEAIDIEAIKAGAREEALRIGIPDEQKLTEAFKIMDYEDRLAFRETMNSQIADIDRMLHEHETELAGIEDFLKTDRVATYTGHVGKRKVHLNYFIKKGDFPESFTVKEAEMLMMGTKPRTIIGGRVPREVVIDELADHFGMEEQQLIDHIIKVADQRIAADDLRILTRMGKARNDNIKRMLGILDDVDTKPEFIPKPEVGVSTGARPVPEGEYRLGIGEQTRAPSKISNRELSKIIDDVPDVNDPAEINYWVERGDERISGRLV